ncbi:hypothetical protein AGMMS49965_24980 [Bacteroidia bacterium]|nr:hypothetical protein AGMMS49965_24980 [Bacteroidia bacterium]
MRIYMDTSAIISSITSEANGPAVRKHLDAAVLKGAILVTSVVAEVEVKRTSQKIGLTKSDVENLLSRYEILPLTPKIADFAGWLGAPEGLEYLRSLDAIHVATAKMGDVDYAITFDKKQSAAFRDSGINVEEL